MIYSDIILTNKLLKFIEQLLIESERNVLFIYLKAITMKINDILKTTAEKIGTPIYGLERKTARIRNGIGTEVSDILGWDVITRAKNNHCYENYVAQPPFLGITQPTPVPCPLGIIPFNTYKVGILEAVQLFHEQNGGGAFTEITLCWPLTHPATPEPYWYFRTNLGNDVIIGANTGHFIQQPIWTEEGIEA